MDTDALEGPIAWLAAQAKAMDAREPRPYRPGERVYAEGKTIPGAGYTLLRRYPRKPGENGKGLVRCDGCGAERDGFYAQMSHARVSGCIACLAKRRTIPRLCKSCGTTDPDKFQCATECRRCQRRANRNGRDAEGRAVFKGPWWERMAAPCQRASTPEGKALWPMGETGGKPHPCGAPVPRRKMARCLVVTTKPNCSVACRNRRAGRRSDQRGR